MSDKNKKQVDIISVAKAANVSPSTVSRYFNHPELVKLVTRRRIETSVRKQGYIRNRAAQTIHGIRSGTIGVIVPTLDHAIFAEVVQSFSDTVANKALRSCWRRMDMINNASMRSCVRCWNTV